MLLIYMPTDTVPQDNRLIEIILEEYNTLRKEILQSLKIQNNIYSAEATTVFGAVAGVAALQKYTDSSNAYIIFLGIPLIFIIFTSLWITEQTRMMRAGNYLEQLEDVLNLENDRICLFWENSLRLKKKSRFSQVQYQSQFVGITGSYFIVSLFSLWSIWTHNVASEIVLLGATIVYGLLFFYILYLIHSITSHSSNIEDFLMEREEYIKKLQRYKLSVLKNKIQN